jgi:proteasome accessory factor B
VPYGSAWDLAAEVASYGPDVVVVSPPEVRDHVIERLQTALQDAS